MLRYTNQIFSPVFGDNKKHTQYKKKKNVKNVALNRSQWRLFYSMRTGDDILSNSNFSPLSMPVNDRKSSVSTGHGDHK